MISVALFFDLINIGLDLVSFGAGGAFVDVGVATPTFTIWFSHLDASLWSSNSIGGTLLAIGLSFFPITDLSFPWTWRVARRAFTARHDAPKQVKSEKPKPTSGFRL